jgi:gluconate 5-dehydrogenase
MRNLFSLEEKCVVVFGGAGYIGKALVRDLLEQGAKVMVADQSKAGLESDEYKNILSNPSFDFVACNIGKADEVRKAYQACVERFGAFNAMVDLVTYGRMSDLETQGDEDMLFSLDGVCGHQLRAIREAIPFFKKSGGGVVVTTASMYGIVSPDYRIYGDSGQNNPVVYGMGKAAVIQLTKYAAAHLAKYHIRVNSVSPGPTPDPSKNPPPDFLSQLAGKTMLGRVGQPADMSGAFIYLLSDASSFTTGETICVDGGWTKW